MVHFQHSATLLTLSQEAKIACNPVTSLHALKANDSEKAETPKTRSVGAKMLASSTEVKTDTKKCVFCECQTITFRPVASSWKSQCHKG